MDSRLGFRSSREVGGRVPFLRGAEAAGITLGLVGFLGQLSHCAANRNPSTESLPLPHGHWAPGWTSTTCLRLVGPV